MKSTMRRYQNEEDYWRIRRFLRDVLILNNFEQVSWDLPRFDYWRWHGILNMKDGSLENDVFIWEQENGEIVAVLNREAPGSTFLQIHPNFRTGELEADMLSIAEQYLTIPAKNHRRSLHVWTEKEDLMLQSTLRSRGYAIWSAKKSEHQSRRLLTDSILSPAAIDGYTIRPMGDIDEHHERCRVSWRAFHPHETVNGFEDDWYHNIQRAPLYRRDLDLVAVAPDGEFAAFCTIWYDDFTRTGLFEPVGTAPEHRRQGLGKAVLTEGLLRLRRLGANIAYVGSYTESAHALYASVGFETYRILEPWIKEIKQSK